jgi:hypothetical protein
VQAVKDALNHSSFDIGVGVLHEPTGRVHVTPINSLPNRGGHAELASVLGLRLVECKGFAIVKNPAGAFVPLNVSHLNGPQGAPGSLQMPQATFAEIVRALQAAGL